MDVCAALKIGKSEFAKRGIDCNLPDVRIGLAVWAAFGAPDFADEAAARREAAKMAELNMSKPDTE